MQDAGWVRRLHTPVWFRLRWWQAKPESSIPSSKSAELCHAPIACRPAAARHWHRQRRRAEGEVAARSAQTAQRADRLLEGDRHTRRDGGREAEGPLARDGCLRMAVQGQG